MPMSQAQAVHIAVGQQRVPARRQSLQTLIVVALTSANFEPLIDPTEVSAMISG